MQNKSKSFRVYFIENKFNWNSVVLLLVTIVILGCLVNYLFLVAVEAYLVDCQQKFESGKFQVGM